MARAEEEVIRHTLTKTGYNKSLAARTLGIHRTLLCKKMEKYRIPASPDRQATFRKGETSSMGSSIKITGAMVAREGLIIGLKIHMGENITFQIQPGCDLHKGHPRVREGEDASLGDIERQLPVLHSFLNATASMEV